MESKYLIYNQPARNGVKRWLHKLHNGLRNMRYKISYRIYRPTEFVKKRYHVAVCAIFKNEALYLREWLEFNHLVGIEHFFLYNNFSDDDYLQVLQPYIDKGWVTLQDWPVQQGQISCYNDCIKNYKEEAEWLGFIDIDEFVVPNTEDNVYDYLKQFSSRPAVLFYWRIYGTSGHLTRDLSGLVTEDFVICWNKYRNVGKCFYNTAYHFNGSYKHNGGLHHLLWADYKQHYLPPVNVFDQPCYNDMDYVPSWADVQNFPVQINHYFTKSYQEYSTKVSKGDVFFKLSPYNEDYFYKHEKKCQSTDYHAYKYLIKLKLVMSAYEVRGGSK